MTGATVVVPGVADPRQAWLSTMLFAVWQTAGLTFSIFLVSFPFFPPCEPPEKEFLAPVGGPAEGSAEVVAAKRRDAHEIVGGNGFMKIVRLIQRAVPQILEHAA